MKKGLFRLYLRDLGECARVHLSAGDAAPYLDRQSYIFLGFTPPFEELPSQDDYLRLPKSQRAPLQRFDELGA
ncbi:MAG TPA: hypothetical protein VJM34_13050 [Novosphingobium sp.]|nr:hypothetical protein [Novosphingobium sp.]